MAGLLAGRVAIVTGGAKGLGRGIAAALTDEGATVVVADVDGEGAAAAATTIERAESATCDVRDDDAVRDLVETVADRHGRLDILVANAGIATVSPLLDLDVETWRSVLAVNLDGMFSSVRRAGQTMAAIGEGGTIITMASITGLLGTALIAHCAAAKAGVISLTQTASVEFKPHRIRVNAIVPGWIGTDLVYDRVADFESHLGLDLAPVIDQAQGRFGEVADVTPLAVFLATDRSRFCTGSAFVVDGGLSASLV